MKNNKPNCERHIGEISYFKDDFVSLAEELGDLRYDSLALFLRCLSDKLNKDASKDRSGGRIKLANSLYNASAHLCEVATSVEDAWVTCEPYMKIDKIAESEHEWVFEVTSLSGRYSHYKCKRCPAKKSCKNGGGKGFDIIDGPKHCVEKR